MSGAISRRRPLPALEFLAAILEYRDGALFWKVRPREHFPTERQMRIWNRLWSGKRAGSPMQNGYRMIAIDNTKFLEHRLICHMVNGGVTDADDVDHIDHDHKNNRAENLRACTHAENSMNQPGRSSKYGLPKHVHWSIRESKYKVTLRAAGKVHFIGTFATLDAAQEAAIGARQRLHGEFEYREASDG